jgi:elongator complex protein 3
MCDIRAREIRGRAVEASALTLRVSEYDTTFASEVFLEYVTPEDRIVGFLRLSLPKADGYIEELGGRALVRELHIYGGAVSIGSDAGGRAQHRGLGARLLDVAERIARANDFEGLAVISAIGTRAYYRRQGFAEGDLYQHRRFETDP